MSPQPRYKKQPQENYQSGNSWFIESDQQKLQALTLFLALIGVLFLYLTHDKANENQTFFWAFLTGTLLLSLAVGMVLFNQKVTIRVDEKEKKLFLKKESLLEVSKIVIRFDEVQNTHVKRIGRASKGFVTYHLIIGLKNGKNEIPGRFSADFYEIQELADRLAKVVGCERTGKESAYYFPASLQHLAISAVGSVAAYILWYRVTTGPICSAMWFGTAPVTIMSVVFLTLFPISRRLIK